MLDPGGGCILDKASKGVYDLEEEGMESLLLWNENKSSDNTLQQ